MNNIRDIPSNQFVILYIPVCYHTVPQVKYRAVTGKLTSDGFRDIDNYSIVTRYGQPTGWDELPSEWENFSS